MKPTFTIRRLVRDSIRMYFAPLTGAYKGIRAEFRNADREMEIHRHAENSNSHKVAHHA